MDGESDGTAAPTCRYRVPIQHTNLLPATPVFSAKPRSSRALTVGCAARMSLLARFHDHGKVDHLAYGIELVQRNGMYPSFL